MDAYTPICYDCHVLMQCTYEVVYVGYPETNTHTIWAADVYECPVCHAKAVSGYAPEPLIRNARPDELADYLKMHPTALFILKG